MNKVKRGFSISSDLLSPRMPFSITNKYILNMVGVARARPRKTNMIGYWYSDYALLTEANTEADYGLGVDAG